MAESGFRATATPIPGLVVWELPVHGDSRGWFKENWQREKMVAAGLPDFGPVQQNISFNEAAGVTRGIHAEPWDKLVSVACGRVFGAWVDLRSGPTFGATFTAELDASRAVFVPRGVGNAYQTLLPGTAYSYLVNEHWSAAAQYTFVNLADERVAIPWPIPLSRAVISEKDRGHPRLDAVQPVPALKALVVGAGGQLGRALRSAFGASGRLDFAERGDLDVTTPDVAQSREWGSFDTVINAAAFTAVDDAETEAGRRAAWATNAGAVAALARVAAAHRLTVVHVSSDYVFDGEVGRPYREDNPVCPLGVYGQSKAAGDAVMSTVARHFVVRTSWVIGEGRNFVSTMARLARSGASPAVVDDQVGRPTFAVDLAGAIGYLLGWGAPDPASGFAGGSGASVAPYGLYNFSNSGPVVSWFELAREVFRLVGADTDAVRPVSTAEYAAGRRDGAGVVAPRPRYSVLDLAKIEATGLAPRDWRDALREYLAG